MHNFAVQKRGFQTQILEIDNALKEAESTKGPVYKITGSIMFLSDKDKLFKEMKERKEVLDLRIKSLEKQEKSLEEKAKTIQAEIMTELDSHMKSENGKPN